MSAQNTSAKKYILPAVGAAVVIGGGVAAYFHFFKGVSSNDALNPQAIAKVVPDDAYMAAYISSDPQAWAKLEQFGTPEARNILTKNLQDFRQQMTKNSGFDYDQDIKPWAGNVMIAMLPQAAGTTAKEPNMLIVIGIKDKPSALSFETKVKEKAKGNIKEEDYKGVKITNYGEGKNAAYTAVVQDYVIVAPGKNAVEQAIDTSKGEPSFSGKLDKNTLPSQGLEVQNPIAKIYLPDYAAAVQQLAGMNPRSAPLPPQTLEQLKQVKAIAAAIGIDDAGIRLKAVTKLDEKLATVEYKPVPGNVVAQFPADTLGLLGGGGINKTWQQVQENAKADPQAQVVIDQMRQQFKQINIDLDKEIFGWMDGEFAIGFLPTNQGLLASTGFGGAMVIDTSDRKTAETTMTKFDTLAKSSGYFSIEQRDVQGKKITEWKTPQGPIFGYGWIDQDSLFLAVGEPIIENMANKPSQPLNNSDTYKAITGSLPKQNVGFFYLDMDKTMSLINKGIATSKGKPVPADSAAVLDAIRGIGVTSTQIDKTTGQIEMLLSLKPAKK